MYKRTITITLPDHVVHKHSILEWEEHLLRGGIIHRDELPLSFGRIAEILADELYKYGYGHFNAQYGTMLATGANIQEGTVFVDETTGLAIDTAIKAAVPSTTRR